MTPDSYIKNPQAFARRLHDARVAMGLTQADLAFPGCSKVYVCRIEQGDRIPTKQVLERLAEKLGVSTHWLITGKEDSLLLAVREVIYDSLSGVEVRPELIERLDKMTLPHWYQDYAEWIAIDPVERAYYHPRPKGVPKHIPHWIDRYRRLWAVLENREPEMSQVHELKDRKPLRKAHGSRK